MSYVPLGLLSAHSLDDSVITINSLVEYALKQGCPALGLAEKNHLFSMVNFYQKALKKGMKPLLGATLNVQVPGGDLECLFYCLNTQGFKNLSRFITSFYKQENNQRGLSLEALSDNPGLIVMIRQESFLAKEHYHAKIISLLKKKFSSHHVFMALERYEDNKKSYVLSQKALALSQSYEISAVAANKVFFLKKEDYQSQQIKYCIQQGQYFDDQKRVIKHYDFQYFYSYEQMQILFHDCPQVLDNTLLIAKKCTTILDFSSIHLPKFSSDENLTLNQMSTQGLKERENNGQLYFPDLERYEKRLHTELEVIEKMGFAGYFLIVADFIQWAKQEGIPVGPGRGSGAGSLIAFVLKITDLDPLQYQLLFERFLNPERVSMPDFDIDFCMEKRDLVIEYVQKRYGLNNVSQIATFGTMAAKAVIRDVGRVLHHPYGFVDKIAKLIPHDIGITLKEALEQSAPLKKLYQTDEVVKQLLDLSLNLEGLPRNVGKHAGGVIIAPRRLDDFCPLYNEPGLTWQPVAHLDKDDIEKIGLVKFDFLGLKTLTVINWTYKNNDLLQGELLSLEKLPLDCQKSFQLLKCAQTTAVFQLESRGMKQLIMKLQPDCFEDMIALVALFRPGPLQSGMVDDFIDRKHGRSKITYLHPLLE
jgi:DNA polymerase-3 subunit alpha